MMDAGHIAVYQLNGISENGGMPVYTPVFISEADFEERTIGVTRRYAAKGIDEQIDMLVRIWRDPAIRIDMIAVVTQSEYDGQYRISNVELTHDGNSYRNDTNEGLKTMDLTLVKLEKEYDIKFD